MIQPIHLHSQNPRFALLQPLSRLRFAHLEGGLLMPDTNSIAMNRIELVSGMATAQVEIFSKNE